MNRFDLTAEQLKSSLAYCPDCGTFTWIVRKSRVTFGKVAACPKTKPAPTICLFGNHYSVLQLAWLAVHGTFPRSKIIPLNGDRCDARASNLMERAAKNGELTAERLRELFSYDPQTGVFRRLVRTSNRITTNADAGCLNDEGYVKIRVDGKKMSAHRMAWLYVHGRHPDGEIDHINGVRHDNRISNLREIDRTGNNQNTHRVWLKNGNFTNVSRVPTGWKARINVNKRGMSLGVYKTPEEAHAAYLAAKRKLHPRSTL